VAEQDYPNCIAPLALPIVAPTDALENDYWLPRCAVSGSAWHASFAVRRVTSRRAGVVARRGFRRLQRLKLAISMSRRETGRSWAGGASADASHVARTGFGGATLPSAPAWCCPCAADDYLRSLIEVSIGIVTCCAFGAQKLFLMEVVHAYSPIGPALPAQP
jgi:hypothetical protein